MTAWLDYFRSGEFAGGCFFNTVRAEFDSRPDSPVRDVVAGDQRQFIALIEREVRKAQEAGTSIPGVDAEQLAFELDALGRGGQPALPAPARPGGLRTARRRRSPPGSAGAALTAAAAGLTDLFGATYDRCRGAPPGALLRGRGRRAALRPRGRPAST
jgi:hypothetical protein